jgi:hypothetical protein
MFMAWTLFLAFQSLPFGGLQKVLIISVLRIYKNLQKLASGKQHDLFTSFSLYSKDMDLALPGKTCSVYDHLLFFSELQPITFLNTENQ